MPTAARRRPQPSSRERPGAVHPDRCRRCRPGNRLVDQTLAAFGRLDVLINNAGIIKTADFLEISEADFDAVLRVNLKGVFLVGQAAARVMVRQGKGAIVNMSSANAVVAIPNQVPYVTSKGAVNQLTKVMALALADKGVRVNAIGPGSILTDLLKVVMSDDAARRRILARTPMGRCGEPAEVAKVALFLASDEASYSPGSASIPTAGDLRSITPCRCRPRSRSTVSGSANLPKHRLRRQGGPNLGAVSCPLSEAAAFCGGDAFCASAGTI